MIVGILSDTHDRIHAAAAGIAVLRAKGAEFFIHCGDVGSQRVLDHLAGLPAAFVWGNTDYDRRGLQRYAADIGVTCLGDVGELELGGKLFVILHGDDAAARRRLLDQQRHDYLLQGHTHLAADQRIGRVRLINPGALHRTRHKTVATLNTTTDAVSFHDVDD